MKTLKQWIALLCAASMLFSLSACSEPAAEDNKQDTAAAVNTPTQPETEETEDDGSLFQTVYDDLPADIKLDGLKVTFLSRGVAKALNEIHVEEMTGEVVNDAVFQREIAV